MQMFGRNQNTYVRVASKIMNIPVWHIFNLDKTRIARFLTLVGLNNLSEEPRPTVRKDRLHTKTKKEKEDLLSSTRKNMKWKLQW